MVVGGVVVVIMVRVVVVVVVGSWWSIVHLGTPSMSPQPRVAPLCHPSVSPIPMGGTTLRPLQCPPPPCHPFSVPHHPWDPLNVPTSKCGTTLSPPQCPLSHQSCPTPCSPPFVPVGRSGGTSRLKFRSRIGDKGRFSHTRHPPRSGCPKGNSPIPRQLSHPRDFLFPWICFPLDLCLVPSPDLAPSSPVPNRNWQ